MDIQSLFNTNIQSLNVKQMPLFQEGKIFFGKVTKLLANDFAWIEVAGKEFSAKLEAPLSVGHGYWFRVEKSKPYPNLKVIAPSTGLKGNAGVDLILKQFVLPQTTKHQEIVSFLMKEGIPFSKGFLREIASWITDSNMSSNLLTLKMMIHNKLPMLAGVFHALHRFMESNDNLTIQMQSLINQLSAVETETPSLKQLIEQLSNILKKIDIPIQENDGHFFLSLKRVINRLGLRYENVLFHVLKGSLPANHFFENFLRCFCCYFFNFRTAFFGSHHNNA